LGFEERYLFVLALIPLTPFSFSVFMLVVASYPLSYYLLLLGLCFLKSVFETYY